MEREQRLKVLKEKIQDAITDYVYETGDNEFSALVEVSAVDGWTQTPEIMKYATLKKINKMDYDQITALASEYAEEGAEEAGVPNYLQNETFGLVATETKCVIKWLLRRFCLVEKRKVVEEYKKACESVDKHSTTTGYLFFVGQKQTIENIFPDLGKEVEE